jgi:hypothetical protein
MMGKDRAAKAKDSKDQGWELFEEETPDGKKYRTGKSKGKPMKNVVISSVNGPMSVRIAIPREAFVDMVKQYFDTKGY